MIIHLPHALQGLYKDQWIFYFSPLIFLFTSVNYILCVLCVCVSSLHISLGPLDIYMFSLPHDGDDVCTYHVMCMSGSLPYDGNDLYIGVCVCVHVVVDV